MRYGGGGGKLPLVDTGQDEGHLVVSGGLSDGHPLEHIAGPLLLTWANAGVAAATTASAAVEANSTCFIKRLHLCVNRRRAVRAVASVAVVSLHFLSVHDKG